VNTDEHGCGNANRSQVEFLRSPATVWEFKGGRVLFDYGVIATRERHLVGWLSPDLGGNLNNHPALRKLMLPPEVVMDAVIGVASSHAHQVYYHWMFDVLPRVGVLQAMGFRSSQIVVNTGLAYQRESLQHLGLDVDALINPPVNFHARVSKLVVPDFLAPIGTPSDAAVSFLRNRFLPPTEPLEKEFEKIFVGRQGAAHRRLINEQQLFSELERHGFSRVNPGEMLVVEQIRVFAMAKIVVGVHGAALTNIVFCSPGTQIIELMPFSYEHECYLKIAGICSLRFKRLRGQASSQKTHDFEIEIPEVLRWLRDYGS